jgi:hypothetical protein
VCCKTKNKLTEKITGVRGYKKILRKKCFAPKEQMNNQEKIVTKWLQLEMEV